MARHAARGRNLRSSSRRDHEARRGIAAAQPGSMRAILAAVAIGSLASCDLDNCTNGDARCVGNVAENCVAHDGGSLWGQDSCDESCVIADGRAICALASTLDPACPSTDATTACVGNTAVSWTACYLTSEQSCAGACIDPTTSTEC